MKMSIDSNEIGPRDETADCTAAARAENNGAAGADRSKLLAKSTPNTRPDPVGVDVHVLSLHIVGSVEYDTKGLWSILRCVGRCLARAQTVISTDLMIAHRAGKFDGPPSTMVWRRLRQLVPCLSSSCIDATSRPLVKHFHKELSDVMYGDRALRTYKAPAPIRIRARGVRIVPDPEARNSVLFDAPLFSGSRCPDCPCKDIIPGDGSPHRISPHCIANGGNAIATLHKLFDSTSGYAHRDLALTIQGGKTQKPKLMARLSYTHPKAQMKSSGQTAGVVMSLSNAVYAVAEDGRSFSRPAEGLMDHIHAAQARMSRIRRGLRTAIGGCVGHGRGRLYRSIEESRSREAKWTDAENWRIANDLARWCEYAGVRRIVAARWTKNVADLPREVQKIVLRWPRAALLSETAASSSKCEQVLARTGIEVVFSDEPECRCPICSDAPLLPWTPNRVAHCPSCGYERERDYARCVCLLDANDVDVKPVIRKREAEYQAAKTALESPQEEPDEGQEGGLRSSKPRKRTNRSKKSVPS